MTMTDNNQPGTNIGDPGGSGGGSSLADLRTRVGSVAGGFSSRQRVRMAMTFVGVAGGVLAFSFIGNQTDWAPLMSQLTPEDAAAVTKQLEAKGIEFQLTDGGTTVEVSKDVVYQARVDIAGTDMPSSGKVGYGILDDQSLTTSEFGQRIGFQRAMEGEMARTIEAIDGVEVATVHLAIPKSDAFVLDEQKASASVMVRTAKGQTLDSGQVQAVVNLVASGIEGLSADRVTVADAAGNVLASPGGAATGASGGSDALREYESTLSGAIEAMLASVVGPGHAKATVSADLDFDAKSSVTETFEPPTTVVAGQPLAASETTKSETFAGGDNGAAPAGILGPDGLPAGTTAAKAGTDYQLNERQVTNALNKVTETTNRAPGAVKRLSVAVVVDEKAIDAAQVTELESLVSAAAGIDTVRGDTVAVSRLPFDETVSKALAAELKGKVAVAEGLPIWVYGAGGVGGLALIGMMIMLLKGRKGEDEDGSPLALGAGSSDRVVTLTTTPRSGSAANVGVGAGARPIGSGGSTGSLDLSAPGTERREILGELIDNQPDEVAQLLRSWLGDRREVSR